MRIALALFIALAACASKKPAPKAPAADTAPPREEAAPAPGGAEATSSDMDEDDPGNDPMKTNEDPCQGGE